MYFRVWICICNKMVSGREEVFRKEEVVRRQYQNGTTVNLGIVARECHYEGKVKNIPRKGVRLGAE